MTTKKRILTSFSPEQLLMTSIAVLIIGGNYIANQFLSRVFTGTSNGTAFLLTSFVILLGLIGFAYHHIITRDSTMYNANYDLAYQRVKKFIVWIACYELVHITISYMHLFFIKHYMGVLEAELYASITLIGHFVYFIFWVVSVILISHIVESGEQGKMANSRILKYTIMGLLVAILVAFCCALFSEPILQKIYKNTYSSVSTLLWQFILASILFAISSVITFYYLSLKKYTPVIISAVVGISQILIITFLHNSLSIIVQVHIIAMVALLLAHLLYITHNSILSKFS